MYCQKLSLRYSVGLAALFLGALLSFDSLAGEVPDIERLALTCTACHGQGGAGSSTDAPAIPALSGRPAEELERLLLAFKNGEKPSTMMTRLMAAFSEEDIRALAAYFSARQPVLAGGAR